MSNYHSPDEIGQGADEIRFEDATAELEAAEEDAREHYRTINVNSQRRSGRR